MSFGLTNVGAIYQRVMTCIFDDLIYKYIKWYAYDLVVKGKAQDDHINNLRIIFDRIQSFNLKIIL